MLALSLRFPAGRYHATPWGRHVNEGDVAWPPEPWRLARALVATWHRKLDARLWPRQELAALLARLAGEAPAYRLPGGVHAHTRHYMPGTAGVVFDAFARVDPGEPLVVCWPGVELPAPEAELLDALLAAIGYLGRAESWLLASRLDRWDGEANCGPAGEAGEEPGVSERLELLAPRPPADYAAFRSHFLQGAEARSGARARRALATSLPAEWLDALAVETADLQAAGWSRPPAATVVPYLRPAAVLRPVAAPRRRAAPAAAGLVTTARFALYGRPLPRVEDGVQVGEWLRLAAVGRAGRALGQDAVPPVLSGHGQGAPRGHRHAFYLPEDADGDGRIDHLVVHAPAGLDAAARQALAGLTWLGSGGGVEWQLLLEGLVPGEQLGAASRLLAASPAWVSVAPYLHPWHTKRGFDVEAQLRRECGERGLPDLADAEWLPAVRVGGRERFPVHFRRFRTKRGLTQPDRRGSFWRLTFARPVRGPVALGFGCHFGLGLFAAAEEPPLARRRPAPAPLTESDTSSP